MALTFAPLISAENVFSYIFAPIDRIPMILNDQNKTDDFKKYNNVIGFSINNTFNNHLLAVVIFINYNN